MLIAPEQAASKLCCGPQGCGVICPQTHRRVCAGPACMAWNWKQVYSRVRIYDGQDRWTRIEEPKRPVDLPASWIWWAPSTDDPGHWREYAPGLSRGYCGHLSDSGEPL